MIDNEDCDCLGGCSNNNGESSELETMVYCLL